MNKGIVKFFNHSKGFGFIIDDESKTEYFVHVTGLTTRLMRTMQLNLNYRKVEKA